MQIVSKGDKSSGGKKSEKYLKKNSRLLKLLPSMQSVKMTIKTLQNLFIGVDTVRSHNLVAVRPIARPDLGLGITMLPFRS